MDALLVAVLALLSVTAVVAATRRRASARAGDVSRGAKVGFPCRVSWRAVTGRRSFVYGKISTGGSGSFFVRPFRSPVPVPEGSVVRTEKSWRAGMSVLTYRTAGGAELRVMVSDADVPALSSGLNSV